MYHKFFDEKENHFELMWKLLKEIYCHDQVNSTWVFARLEDWKYNLYADYKRVPSFFRENAELWFNSSNEILGFAISEDGKGDFYIFTRPGQENLYGLVLEWVKENWLKRTGKLFTKLFEDKENAKKILLDNGFKDKGVSEISRKYDLIKNGRQKIELEKGFRIISMDESNDWYAKKKLYNKAFQKRDEVTDLDMQIMKYWKEIPSFNPEFSLSVVDEKGNHLSACYAFVDFENKIAEIEKVCTHPDYRRRGFATMVIRECFNRLLSRGIDYAYITGSSEAAKATYGGIGKHIARNVILYEFEAPV